MKPVPVLDGLRGIAILMVLVYHTWLFSWYTPEVSLWGARLPVDAFARAGYLGVDVFFVLSGFVLFLPYARRPVDAPAPDSPRRFAFKRALKVLPSYAVALACTLASLRSLQIAVGPRDLAAHALLFQNFVASDIGRANSVFWSLAVEAQFYLVFPLLAPAFRRRPVAVALALIALANAYRYGVAGCCLVLEPVTRQVPAFSDEFALGMFAAYAVARTQARPDAERFAARCTLGALAASAAVVWCLLGANDVTYIPGGREHWLIAHRTFFGFAVAAFAYCSCFAVAPWRAAVANPVFRYLALVSYNLYLWHALVMIWMWKSGVPRAASADPHADDAWKAAFIFWGWTASLAIATAITYALERPLLGLVRPQRFALPWNRLIPRPTAPARWEKRT